MYTFNPSTQKQRQVDLISEFQVSQAYLVKSCLKTRQLCQSELPFLDPPRPQTPRTLSNSVHSSQGFTSLLWLSQNSLCRPGWPPTLTKGLLDSGILGLKACATMPGIRTTNISKKYISNTSCRLFEKVDKWFCAPTSICPSIWIQAGIMA